MLALWYNFSMKPGQVVEPNNNPDEVDKDTVADPPRVINNKRSMSQEHTDNLEMDTGSGSTGDKLDMVVPLGMDNIEQAPADMNKKQILDNEADEARITKVVQTQQDISTEGSDTPIEFHENSASQADTNKYLPAKEEDSVRAEVDETPIFTWKASEYLKHNHTIAWYIGMVVATAGLIGIIVLISGGFGFQEILSAFVVILMFVSIIVYAHKNPRELNYTLSSTGIFLGDKYYSYSDFHSYAVLPYHGQLSIELDPLKRFMPRVSLPLEESHLAEVGKILEARLPRTERELDIIDRISHRLKI
jgi:hypothetical protein